MKQEKNRRSQRPNMSQLSEKNERVTVKFPQNDTFIHGRLCQHNGRHPNLWP
jgi:hypothetical protein